MSTHKSRWIDTPLIGSIDVQPEKVILRIDDVQPVESLMHPSTIAQGIP